MALAATVFQSQVVGGVGGIVQGAVALELTAAGFDAVQQGLDLGVGIGEGCLGAQP